MADDFSLNASSTDNPDSRASELKREVKDLRQTEKDLRQKEKDLRQENEDLHWKMEIETDELMD